MTQQFQGINLLRTIAIALVLLLHSCECYFITRYLGTGSYESLDISALKAGSPDGGLFDSIDMDELQSEAVWAVIFESLTRCCVPLFVMISGFLLLPLQSGLSMGTFYRKRASRVLIPLACWTVIYSIYSALKFESGLNTPLDYLLNILKTIGISFINFQKHVGHLWYVYMLMGLYLIIPILSPWVERASRRQMHLVLGCWFVTLLLPFFRMINPEIWGECPWNPFGAQYYLSGFIGYLLAGAYVRKLLFDRPAKTHTLLAWGLTLLGFVSAVGCIVYPVFFVLPSAGTDGFSSVAKGFEISWSYCGFPMCLMALGIFLLCFRCSMRRLSAVVQDFSRLSYGIYLCHIPLLVWLCEKVFILLQCPAPICILGIWICTIILSYLFTRLLSFLPFSKWLIGV